MPSYKLTPQAVNDLEAIWRYTEDEWGVIQAEFYLDQIDDAFKLLGEQPQLVPIREEFTPPVRIYHHAHHLIVYDSSSEGAHPQDTHPEGIVIIRVLHESMDIASRLIEQ